MAKHQVVDGVKQKKPEHYGLVSEYQKVPLFDKNCYMDHTFTKDFMDRRFDEVMDCAQRAGFKGRKNRNGSWTFKKPRPPLRYNMRTFAGESFRMEPHDNIGDLIPISDFVESCRLALFTDYDGDGVFATATEQSNIVVHPSEIYHYKTDTVFYDNIPIWATHVMWYNK